MTEDGGDELLYVDNGPLNEVGKTEVHMKYKRSAYEIYRIVGYEVGHGMLNLCINVNVYIMAHDGK